jgi:hypothetical protein
MDLSQSQEGAGGVGGLLSVVDTGEVYHYLSMPIGMWGS